MRRASVLAAQLAQRAGSTALLGTSEQAAVASCVSLPQALASQQHQAWQQPMGSMRGFAAGAPPKVVPNPLQKVVPQFIQLTAATYRGTIQGLNSAYSALLTSGATKAAVSYYADKVLLSGTFVDMQDIQVAHWAAWLASAGYTNPAGWAKISTWAKAQHASLSAPEVTALVTALQSTGYYDKALFDGLAGVIKAKFTEFDTPGLCAIVRAYNAEGHYDQELFDDIADSIAYCNHYLAPTTVSLSDITAVFEAYAKYGHDRADLFIPLARAIFEDRLKALGDKELNSVVMGLLRSFNKLEFWPDCTEALFVVAELRPGAFAGGDSAEIDTYVKKVESYAGGSLPWLEGGYKDWEHFHGKPFGDYNLWTFRDDLVPQYYKPTDVKVFKE